MSKKIVMYLLMSVVASVVFTMGSFSCENGPSELTLIVVEPEGCTLIEPEGVMDGMTYGSSIVKVMPGKNHFVFDCDGERVETDKEVKSSDMQWAPKIH